MSLNAKSVYGKASQELRLILSAIDDVTEGKRLEIQLRQAQKMESIGTLAAGIKHFIDKPYLLNEVVATLRHITTDS